MKAKDRVHRRPARTGLETGQDAGLFKEETSTDAGAEADSTRADAGAVETVDQGEESQTYPSDSADRDAPVGPARDSGEQPTTSDDATSPPISDSGLGDERAPSDELLWAADLVAVMEEVYGVPTARHLFKQAATGDKRFGRLLAARGLLAMERWTQATEQIVATFGAVSAAFVEATDAMNEFGARIQALEHGLAALSDEDADLPEVD